jgi:hypothetical protein
LAGSAELGAATGGAGSVRACGAAAFGSGFGRVIIVTARNTSASSATAAAPISRNFPMPPERGPES